MPSGNTILVVDDDPDVRDAICMYMELQGYATCVAANGREALDVLTSLAPHGTPCLILLDLMMPVMDGYAFRAEQMQAPAHAAIPVVVMTAGSQIRSGELAPVAVIRKPLDLCHLMSTIREHC